MANKKIAIVSPIIAEFGWIVFDIQSKVRHFFESHSDCEKIIFANPALEPIFEHADHIINVDLPKNYTPCGRGAEDCSGYHNPNFYNKIISECKQKFNPDYFLEIPYMDRFGMWDYPNKYKKFYGKKIIDDETYITISCRNLSRGKSKNWSERNYQEVVSWLKTKFNIPIYLVGLPKDNFVPDGVIVPETKNVGDHISLLSHSKFHFGSNTGTSHLATMCGCPLLTWGHGVRLKDRMEKDTNPFKTKVEYIEAPSWNPSVDQVKTHINNLVEEL